MTRSPPKAVKRVAGNGRRNVKNSTRKHTDIMGASPAFARSARPLLADAAHIPGEPVVIARPMRCMALAGRLSGRVPKYVHCFLSTDLMIKSYRRAAPLAPVTSANFLFVSDLIFVIIAA